ncbi:borealin [Bufo gargarizans]|uniref:borealin n=1 Tax=Bufo gargarizans TaxID=30331 RepID=UPI001CF500E1|nr:borealin [Bufo gargarizans]XP_044142385.1 borealin [Bufo gargarizans]XP_044142386.1 borealin [Bufo gargarizans]
MAPKKRTNRGQKTRTMKNEKLASFIKDFDSQVKTIVEELKANVVSNLKEVDSLYNIEIIKLPIAIREMRWIDFFAKGGSLKALEAAAMVNADIEKVTSSVSQTPFKPAKKARKVKANSIEELVENISVTSVLRQRTNNKTSTKRLGTARKARISAASTTAKRTSKRTRATPSNSRLADSSMVGYTPMITPKIDTRVFKTPALRTPAMREPVYTFSANGSPLAGMDDLFINLPTDNGKNIRLTANDMDGIDLRNLDQKAFENIKLLSSRLEKICKTLK